MQKNSAKKIETTRGSVMSKSDSERSSDEVTETKPTYNTRKQRATNPKKRQRNARGDAGNEKKRVKTNGGTPSRRSRKWYTSYKGALAFALFKVKTWMLRDTGFLDVTLQADKKKYGGSGTFNCCPCCFVVVVCCSHECTHSVRLGHCLSRNEDYSGGISEVGHWYKCCPQVHQSMLLCYCCDCCCCVTQGLTLRQ